MKRWFVYIYFMRNEPDIIKEVVSDHVEYWQEMKPEGYLGGPFADKTGGMITFMAENMTDATAMIREDPFLLEDLILDKWVKEWLVE